MEIIENGQPIEDIPYPVEIWNADFHMWDDSIEEPTSSKKVKTRTSRTLIQIMRNTRNGTR